MTTFLDGPAKGQHLLLKRSPEILHVVQDTVTGKWDALDQPEDAPRKTEAVFTYKLKANLGRCHIYAPPNGSGFYEVSEYVYQGEDQPLTPVPQ